MPLQNGVCRGVIYHALTVKLADTRTTKETIKLEITAQMVKELREKTGAGPKQCKDALVEANGDMKRAEAILEEKNQTRGEKLIASGRETKQGIVYAYIHTGGRIGAMVELNCETDFVARTDGFKQLAHNIALQIASMNPRYVGREEVIGEEGSAEELALLEQPYVKDPKKNVQQLIKETIASTGENITIRRFARFEVGGA